ncbi:MAG: type II secretion system protein GspG [Deltaproteobacteria bacterium]|nr:type II secretion system protein GspG [Deltaproteobacteria bacterium]
MIMDRQQPHIDAQRGFTLIELMIVIVILGLLAGLVAPRLIGRIGGAKQGTAQAQIEMLATACDTFRLDMGRFPASLEELIANPGEGAKWDGPYLKKNQIPLDPWDNPYQYSAPGEGGRDYDIVSYGADKTEGGDGENRDIMSWASLNAPDAGE